MCQCSFPYCLIDPVPICACYQSPLRIFISVRNRNLNRKLLPTSVPVGQARHDLSKIIILCAGSDPGKCTRVGDIHTQRSYQGKCRCPRPCCVCNEELLSGASRSAHDHRAACVWQDQASRKIALAWCDQKAQEFLHILLFSQRKPWYS